MDMTQEKDPAKLIPEGWQAFEVVRLEEQTSKAGNQMFKISLVLADDMSTGTDVFAVAEAGKRWFLKQLLTACGCEAGQDGVYDWDVADVEGKTIQGRVEHIQETWIDREGRERKTPKSKVVEFKKLSVE